MTETSRENADVQVTPKHVQTILYSDHFIVTLLNGQNTNTQRKNDTNRSKIVRLRLSLVLRLSYDNHKTTVGGHFDFNFAGIDRLCDEGSVGAVSN